MLLSSRGSPRVPGNLNREIVRPLSVWDAVAQAHIVLEPGTAVRNCKIRRSAQAELEVGAAPYIVSFEAGEHGYETSLPKFQARTQFITTETVESPVLHELEVRR